MFPGPCSSSRNAISAVFDKSEDIQPIEGNGGSNYDILLTTFT